MKIGPVCVRDGDASRDASNAHSAARIQQTLQNLSVTGLPISLTEFGVQDGQGKTIEQAKA